MKLPEQNGKDCVYCLETVTIDGGEDCICACVGTVSGAFRRHCYHTSAVISRKSHVEMVAVVSHM